MSDEIKIDEIKIEGRKNGGIPVGSSDSVRVESKKPPATSPVIEAPKLLVEWSSPWDEFRSALQPAMMRSPRRLAGEAPVGIFPYRGMVATWAAEIVLFALVIYVMGGFDTIHIAKPPSPSKYEVIYYAGQELPKTADVGGAQSGHSGRSGGHEAHHPTQVIRVARGETLREKVVDAPKLNLPRSESAVANLLAIQRVPGPPPAEGIRPSLRTSLRAPSPAQLAAIAPPPDIQHEKMRSEAMLASTVVPPAPSAGEMSTLRLPGSQPVQVIPPPVSAPERASNSVARLTLPAPAVVAPPPQISQQISKNGPGFGPGELQKQVVPPPAQLGNIANGERRTVAGLGTGPVVPPPVQIGAGTTSNRQQTNLSGASTVVPPPVQIGAAANSNRQQTNLGGASTVVPPPAQLSGNATSGRQMQSGLGVGSSVVPPAPTIAGGSSPTGRGRGSRGGGLGGPGELGDLAAPPTSGGNGKNSGVVLSDQPGSKVGVPGSSGAGSLAMSPQGGDKAGLGGYGGGNGISRGNGSGSGLSGEGTGAGHEGSGHGSDPTARGGISPYPGKGGAGNAAAGDPPAPGVEVSGGTTNVVNLPSFSQGGSEPTDPSRSSASREKGTGITIVATPRSGGAFNFYGAMKGDKVYTRYIDTALGVAVMQFSDPATAAHPYMQDLSSPQPMRVDLPAGLHRGRMVIACVLDRTGMLQNPQVIEPGEPATTAKVLAALSSWKFSPAMRGNQPVEVNAILGFGIDTNDRY